MAMILNNRGRDRGPTLVHYRNSNAGLPCQIASCDMTSLYMVILINY